MVDERLTSWRPNDAGRGSGQIHHEENWPAAGNLEVQAKMTVDAVAAAVI